MLAVQGNAAKTPDKQKNAQQAFSIVHVCAAKKRQRVQGCSVVPSVASVRGVAVRSARSPLFSSVDTASRPASSKSPVRFKRLWGMQDGALRDSVPFFQAAWAEVLVPLRGQSEVTML